MKPARTALHLAGEADTARQALIEASAREGLHISDLQRADIRKRDWRGMHVRAGRRDPIALADASTRHRDGREVQLRAWRLG